LDDIVLEKENRNEPTTLTDNDLFQVVKQTKSKKSQPLKMRGKKVKEDVASDFIIPVPKVDIIETAYLPLFSRDSLEISKKKEDILMRKVADWSQFIKPKKDRR
jgi:hypothetical protein